MSMVKPTRLICTCRNKDCLTVLGEATNSWIQIGKGHFCPVNQFLPDFSGLEPAGEIREAPVDSCGADTEIQDLLCSSCHQTIGLWVHDAPKGQVLKPNHVILRRSTVDIRCSETDNEIPLQIREWLSPDSKSDERTMTRSKQRSRSRDASHVTIEETVDHSEKSVEGWMMDMIEDQRNDLDRITGIVGRIEKDMQSFKSLLRNIQEELGTKAGPYTVEMMQKEQSELRHDFVQLHEHVMTKSGHHHSDSGGDFGAEIELLTENISKASQKANEVDTIKMEMQLIKNRLKRLEETMQVRSKATPESSANQGKTTMANRQIMLRNTPTESSSSKRKLMHDESGPDDIEILGTYPKRSKLNKSAFAMSRENSKLRQGHLLESIEIEHEDNHDDNDDEYDDFDQPSSSLRSFAGRSQPGKVKSHASDTANGGPRHREQVRQPMRTVRVPSNPQALARTRSSHGTVEATQNSTRSRPNSTNIPHKPSSHVPMTRFGATGNQSIVSAMRESRDDGNARDTSDRNHRSNRIAATIKQSKNQVEPRQASFGRSQAQTTRPNGHGTGDDKTDPEASKEGSQATLPPIDPEKQLAIIRERERLVQEALSKM